MPSPPAPQPSSSSAEAEGIVNVVIGTAGHIDHGKSLLVKRLTDIDPDRLKEEQERGITIDLGFAPLVLAGGQRVGMIDVPGHERFVKNMIAGATGIDLVLLVVAADDGVMPQTREHVEIVDLLGVQRGIVAITKIDQVDAELVEVVEEEVRDLVAGTPLERAPVCRVSSITGAGIEALREVVEAEVARIERKTPTGPFRMPIQRVFSMPGFGAVVTGVPLSGTTEPGAELEILPGALRGRVKGLQAYRGTIARARAGHSTAINFSGMDYHGLSRGQVVADPGIFTPARLFEARLRVLSSCDRPLKHRTPIRFHTGTVEMLGRVLLLAESAIAPGTSSLVQLALDEPVVVAPGDRFVLRRQSPVITLAGGVVLSATERRLRRGRRDVLEDLAAWETCLDHPERLAAHVLARAPGPLALSDLVRQLAQAPATVEELAGTLANSGEAVFLSGRRWLVAREVLERLCARVTEALADYFARHPQQETAPLPELRGSLELSPSIGDALLAHMAAEGQIRVTGNRVAPAGREAQLTDRERELLGPLEALYRESGHKPPSPEAAAGRLDAPEAMVGTLIDLLADQGKLVKAGAEIYFHAEAIAGALKAIDALAAEGPFTTSAIRQDLGTSRKYIIPLLEHFDAAGLTARRGDRRIRTPKKA